ncbi:DNA polymerase [Jatrophihabitans sp.]|uniref:DNA polymerase n=1 Tax=Jatrophihabitans sp. TaxID=1932789 RepID=UPI0030C7101F|nr:family phage/plasmid primase-like protein [Jatrophihabitans sp.]
MTVLARPFADTVVAYHQAGWPAILPVPPEKSPPPVGYTGADGIDTDPVQLVQWATSHAGWSIALRMPDGVIGIDVDAYEKHGIQKHGEQSYEAALAAWGPLPATWSSTARGAGQPSRISFYRVPPGRYATKLAGGDVEIIQRHHRYAVVWPSPHTEAGDIYRWYDPSGAVVEAPPKPGELPELPAAWVAGLREGATDPALASADRGSGEYLLAQLLADDRPACAEITSAVMTAVDELTKADAGSRHDTATGRVHHLVQLAAVGHPGLGRAIPTLSELWANLTAGEDRGEEWERMLLTSARKAVTAVGIAQVANDPCTIIGGIPIATPGGPAPGDDRPDAEQPEPIQPSKLLHPLEVIGGHVFDTKAGLDQRLAEAVLQRMYPVLRYGYDAKAWLLRGRANWEIRDDLSEWAVAQVAELVPRGDPDAEKGSELREQADRRKRLMSAGPSSAIAKKIRAVVASGSHPAALAVGDLDSEPWLIWAGGMPWDLTMSLDGPTLAATVDPATPHMRAAGVAPELRPTPLWDAFTAAVFPDPDLRAWALRVLAVSLTGYSDKALPILIGEKDRGKTQVVHLLMSVLGSYAHSADPRLLNGLDNAHASIIFALKGRRLSFIDEGPRDGRLGQERLKQLTGGGDLTGNQMNRNPITFSTTHTLVLTANDEPLLTDPAVRGRVRLLPCEGDPDLVRAARKAIGHTTSRAWRREAPGVLAAMMREAAAWLADQDSALTANAPEAYRFRAEEIAVMQDPVRTWLEEETEPFEQGTRSRELYEAFVGWSRNGNAHPNRIPSETKWGRDLTNHGYPAERRRDGNVRLLHLRPRTPWIGGGLTSIGGGFVDGSPSTLHAQERPEIAGLEPPVIDLGGGLEGLSQTTAHARTHAGAHVRAHEDRAGTTSNPPQPSTPSTPPISAQITAKLLEAKAAAAQPKPAPERPAPVKPKRTKIDPAERAAQKAAAKAEAKAAKIADAAGDLVQLPAVVTRDGAIRPLELGKVHELLTAFGALAELTVDVEHTGYPIGHADYALRTIQLGNDQVAAVLDADDPAHRQVAKACIEAAVILHAHSATADLVPLAIAEVLDIDRAWDRMHDTVIPALLADPQSTGSDADGLKELARDMLGTAAVAPNADEARAALFKAGGWLKQTDATTPIERSGWAQVDHRSSTMIRYDASDVLDTAALARTLPAPPPAILHRERIAQRATARAAHLGVRIDGEHVDRKLPEHKAALQAAGEQLRTFGITNPGSDQEVANALLALGAPLPTTKTGRASVAKAAVEPLRHDPGPIGELARARLEYQHHETVIGLFLEPYSQLVHRGDGRARPTVYTLGADTGRMSCVRPNLQQLSRQGGIRACITADPGYTIVRADFASVEIRVAAALTGDPNLRAMLEAGVDLHMQTAKQAYGPDATKEDRYNTKRGVFGKLYGSGIAGIARTLGISQAEAAAIAASLDAMTPGMARWIVDLKQSVQRGMRSFETYSGRVVHLDGRQPHKAFNYCVQGTARELLVDTLVRWQDTPWRDCVLIPVHDEVLVFVPEADAAAATAALVAAMETELYGVRIIAEAAEPAFVWADAS